MMNPQQKHDCIVRLQALQERLGKDQPLTLALGDLVVYTGERFPLRPFPLKYDHLIGTECVITGMSKNGMQYTINNSGFVSRDCLTFVRRADEKSLATAIDILIEGKESTVA